MAVHFSQISNGFSEPLFHSTEDTFRIVTHYGRRNYTVHSGTHTSSYDQPLRLLIWPFLEQAEENRLRKEDDLRMKREEESKKDEEKLRKKEEEKARREAILHQFKLKKEMDNDGEVIISWTFKPSQTLL